MKTHLYYILIYSVSLLVIIGCSDSKIPTENDNDESNACWNEKTRMPTPRYGQSSCALNGEVYMMGGMDRWADDDACTTVEVYDPAQDTWTTKAEMLIPRANFATCVLNGKIYALGGTYNFYQGEHNTIEVYDPAQDTWTMLPNMPRGRMGPAASVVNGKIYIIGGADGAETPIKEVDI